MNHYSLAPANFSDYRDFLNSRFVSLKSNRATFSIKYLAQKSGISKAHMQFVLRKKRHLGIDKLPALAKALKMTSDEEYFTYMLICKNMSKNPKVRAHFEKILSRIRHEYRICDEIELTRSVIDEKDHYSNYLKVILKTVVGLDKFNEAPNWILENLLVPNLKKETIKEVLNALELSGAIRRCAKDNKLKPEPETLWRPDPYDPNGQKVYTRAAEALASLMQNPEIYKPSVYSSMSLSFDEINLAKAEKLMIDVHHKLTLLSAESKSPNAVVYIGNYLLTVLRLLNTAD